jgi:hypothetical protein
MLGSVVCSMQLACSVQLLLLLALQASVKLECGQPGVAAHQPRLFRNCTLHIG